MTVLSNSPTVEAAAPDDLDAVVANLDEEFIRRRGRKLSFAARYPSVYCRGNLGNIFVIRDAGRVVSSVAVKRGSWLEGNRTLRFAMIGGVWTAPEERGRGLASTVLRHVDAVLREADLDFAVLWTGRAGFYQRLGWRLADGGVFGALRGALPRAARASVHFGPLVAAEVPRLEAVRDRWLPCRVARATVDYRTVPIPAEQIERFAVGTSEDWTAYALVGRLDSTGYVYEVVGDPTMYAALWGAIATTYEAVRINECRDSPCRRWLDAHADVSWSPQHLAMWRVFSGRLAAGRLERMCISWLDRM